MNDQVGESKKQTGTGFAGPALVVVVLAIISYLTFEPRLLSIRPETSSSSPAPPARAGFKSIYARLWQDPFTPEYQKLWTDNGSGPNENEKRVHKYFQSIVKQLQEEDEGDLLVMPILLPGGPSIDDQEFRRRTRYAVLAGLAARDYIPESSSLLTYVKLTVNIHVNEEVDNVEEVQDSKNDKRPQGQPYVIPIRLLSRDGFKEAALAPTWEGSKDKELYRGKIGRILICWINQSQLGSRPMDAIFQIVERLFEPDKSLKDRIQVCILGPTGSDGLYAMASEWNKTNKPYFRGYKKAVLYSPRATISVDGPLSEDREQPKADVLKLFLKAEPTPFGLQRIIRTIGTDAQLAKALKKELEHRRAWPTNENGKSLVLVTELDTSYGRTLPETFKKLLADKNFLHVYHYFRGLDGKVPGKTAKDEKESENASKAKEEEAAQGPAQIDYLRRLHYDLLKLQRKLQRYGREISAIGVVGTDVYDKLLVLRALRKDFPRAWFFTTDLDAVLTHPRELKYTRNVLVASHFALELQKKVHDSIVPPFRDSYQTALFFTCLLAITDERLADRVNCEGPWCPESRRDQSATALSLKPLMFEIGRTGPYQLTNSNRDGVKNKGIHPEGPHKPRWSLAWFAFLGALVAIWFCVIFFVARARRILLGPAAAGVVFLTFAIVLFVWFMYDPEKDEPLTFTESISVWPATMLRYLAAILSLFFLWKSSHDLNKSYHKVLEELTSEKGEAIEDEVTEAPGKGRILSQWWACVTSPVGWFRTSVKSCVGWLVRVRKAFGENYQAGLSQVIDPVKKCFRFVWDALCQGGKAEEYLGSHKSNITVNALCTNYYRITNTRLRLTRSMIFSGIYYFAGTMLFVLTTFPSQPHRGPLARWVDWMVLKVAIFLMIVLVFFVIDAGQLARKFIRRLAKLNSNLGDQIQWEIRIVRGIAEHTKTIGQLIYYPVVVTVLMAFSRHHQIDNFDFPWALVALLGLNLLLAVAVSWNLRQATRKAREDVLRRLEEGLSQVVGSKAERAEEFKFAIRVINEEHTGAFRPFFQDPLFLAFAIPFGGVGSVVVLERLAASFPS